MEGKVIKSVEELKTGYTVITFTDGTWLLVKVACVGGDIPAETTNDEAPQKPNKKEKEERVKEEPEEEEEDSLTGEDLAGMSYKALKKLCKENDLDTDPSDFDEDDEDEFRNAIAKELGLDLPEDDEPEPDDDDAELTWEDLEKLDYDELSDLIDEKKLDTDADDFESDEEDKLRRAIAEELDIEAPKKEKKDKKDKKDKKNKK